MFCNYLLYNECMTNFGVEQVKFGDSIGTEPRFKFRRWLEAWVEAVNSGNRQVWQVAVLDVITVSDLLEKDLNYEKFVSYLTHPPKQLRIPLASVVEEDGLYVVRGSLEIFTDGLMIFEGTFEMTVHDVGVGEYKIFGMVCYPHFRVSV